jgi:CheY-like chemotaxis protein
VLRVLTQHGYHVLEASNRSEALAEVQRHDQRIDLLLTDVVMPEGSGNTLATELVASRRIAQRAVHVGLRAATRWSRSRSAHAGRGFFLSKPFTPDQLLRGVRSVLDAVRN